MLLSLIFLSLGRLFLLLFLKVIMFDEVMLFFFRNETNCHIDIDVIRWIMMHSDYSLLKEEYTQGNLLCCFCY